MASRSIRFRPAAMAKLLEAPNGTVGQHMQSIGRKTTVEAQRLADAELERQTGAYHRGFRSRTIVGAKGPRLMIENNATTRDGRQIAPMVEKGTRPHIIRPRSGRVLVFQVDGRAVFARLVNHPGTRAYRIMERALRRVVGR